MYRSKEITPESNRHPKEQMKRIRNSKNINKIIFLNKLLLACLFSANLIDRKFIYYAYNGFIEFVTYTDVVCITIITQKGGKVK